jgi:hypothetical protein
MVGVVMILMEKIIIIIIIIIVIIYCVIIEVLAQRPLSQLQRQHRDIRKIQPGRTYKLRHVQRGNKNESNVVHTCLLK